MTEALPSSARPKPIFESKHFRFLVESSDGPTLERAALVQQASSASTRLEVFYDGLAELGLVPSDEQIDVFLVAIGRGEPPEEERGVDVVPGVEVGVRAFCDPRLRTEWLARDIVKVFLTEVVGQHARSCVFVIDGLVGHLAALAGQVDRSQGDDIVRRAVEKGVSLDVASLLAGRGEMPAELYHAFASSFISHVVSTQPKKALRAFVAGLADHSADEAARLALGRSLPVVTEGWLAALRQPRVGSVGLVAFGLRFLSLGKSQWRSMVGVLFGICLGIGFEAAIPLTTRFVIDKTIGPRDARLLGVVLAALTLLFVVQSLAGIAREYVAASLGARVADVLRVRLFTRLQELALGYFMRVPLGQVVSKMTVDAGVVEQGFTEAVPMFATLTLSLLLNTVLLFVLDARLAGIALVAVPLAAVSMRWVIPRSGRALQMRQQLRADLGTIVAENFQAQSVVRAFGLEGAMVARFSGVVSELAASNRSVAFLTGVVNLSAAIPVALVQIGSLGIGAWFVMRGELTVGSLVAFLAVLSSVLGPMKAISVVLPSLQRAAVSLQRLDEILAERSDVRDAVEAKPMPPLEREIRLDDVTFTYTGEQTNLDGVTLTLPAKKSIVFVGPSGSGKSTILSLLMRFYDPTGGAVTIDGANVRALTIRSLREKIAVVFQESFLFDVSVRENIRLGKLSASDEEIEAAARAAEIHEIVMSLPNGYDTKVGERGNRLSGGQRQRVAIARALVRNPSILILDEATSALDAKTEASINDTLKRASRGRTVLAVTHRLTWAEDADLICTLDRGRVVEQGTHAELLACDGVYRQLWDHQKGFIVNERGRIVGIEPARLSSIPLFQGLRPDHLDSLAREFAIERRAAGDDVFVERDPADKFFVVGRGRVDVHTIDPTGTKRHLATLRDGDYFGEIGLMSAGLRTASVSATVPTELLVLEGARFLELVAKEPGLRETLLKNTRAKPPP